MNRQRHAGGIGFVDLLTRESVRHLVISIGLAVEVNTRFELLSLRQDIADVDKVLMRILFSAVHNAEF